MKYIYVVFSVFILVACGGDGGRSTDKTSTEQEQETSSKNNAPSAISDNFSTKQNSAIIINETQLLANDSDLDNDVLAIFSIENPINGTVDFNQLLRQITFTPNINYHGQASFSYQINDGTDNSVSTVVMIAVEQVIEEPIVDVPVVDVPIVDDVPIVVDVPVVDLPVSSGKIIVPTFNNKLQIMIGDGSLFGMNLGGEVYYSPTNYYKDLMRAADPWKTSDENGTRWENDIYFNQIPKRSDGYPSHVPFAVNGSSLLQMVETPITHGALRNTGRYHVFFEGQGEIILFGASLVDDTASGHHIYDIGTAADVNVVLKIMRSDIDDPIHGIAVVHEDDLNTYESQPFNDNLAASLDDFSVIRLMDLMFTNGNAAQTVEHITPLDFYTWNDCQGSVCDGSHFAGHPPEILMQLANHLDVNPWLTFPHQADDDYIRRYAEIVYQNLDEDKYVLIEYSNELWNWMFVQTQWLGVAACADTVTYVEDENGQCDLELSSRRYQTKRSLEIFAIVKDVFGEDSERVITVLAGQGSWFARTQMSLEALNDNKINPNNQKIDLLAIAPYFGGDVHIDNEQIKNFWLASSFEQLRDYAYSFIDNADFQSGIKEHKLLANRFSMELVAYEGGQHFLCAASDSTNYCDDEALMSKLTAFQRHDVMEEVYQYYYDTWFSLGGSLFSVFSHMTDASSRWGAWGTLEYYQQALSETPKRRALQTSIAQYQLATTGSGVETNNEESTESPSEEQPVENPNENEQKSLKTYIFGHSLILHATEQTETTVPHWLYEFSQEAGYNYRFSGQYGFLPQHDNLPPFAQWGFEHIPTIWDDDSGDSFSDINFDSVLITAANFIQYKEADEIYDGDNPDNTTPLGATLSIVDWVRQAEPGIKIYIYENWQDMGDDLLTGSALANYHAETANAKPGGFHRWWLDYHDLLVEGRPDVNIKMIPVGPIISHLLTTTALTGIHVNDLYQDSAPHGQPSIYFLGGLITYMAMYGEKAPENYNVPDTVHALVKDNYQIIVDEIWDELNSFDFSDGQSRVF